MPPALQSAVRNQLWTDTQGQLCSLTPTHGGQALAQEGYGREDRGTARQDSIQLQGSQMGPGEEEATGLELLAGLTLIQWGWHAALHPWCVVIHNVDGDVGVPV